MPAYGVVDSGKTLGATIVEVRISTWRRCDLVFPKRDGEYSLRVSISVDTGYYLVHTYSGDNDMRNHWSIQEADVEQVRTQERSTCIPFTIDGRGACRARWSGMCLR